MSQEVIPTNSAIISLTLFWMHVLNKTRSPKLPAKALSKTLYAWYLEKSEQKPKLISSKLPEKPLNKSAMII